MEALAEAGDWAELDRFSKTQKSPIGYEVKLYHSETVIISSL